MATATPKFLVPKKGPPLSTQVKGALPGGGEEYDVGRGVERRYASEDFVGADVDLIGAFGIRVGRRNCLFAIGDAEGACELYEPAGLSRFLRWIDRTIAKMAISKMARHANSSTQKRVLQHG